MKIDKKKRLYNCNMAVVRILLKNDLPLSQFIRTFEDIMLNKATKDESKIIDEVNQIIKPKEILIVLQVQKFGEKLLPLLESNKVHWEGLSSELQRLVHEKMKESGYVYETTEKVLVSSSDASKFIVDLIKIDPGLTKSLLRNELTYFYFRLYCFDPWKFKNLLLATDTFKMEQNKVETDINGYFAITNKVCDVKKVGIFYSKETETFTSVFSPLLNTVELLAFIALTEKRFGNKDSDIKANQKKMDDCTNENKEIKSKLELIADVKFEIEKNERNRKNKDRMQRDGSLISQNFSSFTPKEERIFSTESIESDFSLLRLKFNDLQHKYLKMMKGIRHIVVNPKELNFSQP